MACTPPAKAAAVLSSGCFARWRFSLDTLAIAIKKLASNGPEAPPTVESSFNPI